MVATGQVVHGGGSAHTHAWTDITGEPETYPPSVHSHPAPAWTDVTGKPATFPPSAHNHPISDVVDLQTTLDGKAPVDHTHEGGGGGGVTAIRRKRITSGNVAGSNTAGSWVVCNNGVEDLAISIPAAVGDVVMVWPRFMCTVGGNIALDLAALGAANAVVQYGSTNGAAPDFDGEPAYYNDYALIKGHGPATFVVTAPMIVSGSVKFALMRRGNSASGTVHADANYSFRMVAINYGAVDFA